MKQLLIALLVIGSGSLCFAQQAKVIKVKGQQAIVQFPKGVTPSVGQSIDVGGGGGGFESDSGSHGGGSTGPRDHLLGISGSLSMLNRSTSGSGTSASATIFKLDGRYGWNEKIMEYGPLASFEMQSGDASTKSTTIRIGGFFDYNLVPNVSGADLVYGAGGEAYFGQQKPDVGDSYTLMGFAAGGFGKWFLLKNTAALRGDVQFEYDRYSSSITITYMGLVAKVGLSVYF